MNEQIQEMIEKYPGPVASLFIRIRQILFDSTAEMPEEKLWAKMPSYYVGESFVRLIPFKDHINIEAKAIAKHKDEISGYKLTPKCMLQIYLRDEIPEAFLRKVFAETLK